MNLSYIDHGIDSEVMTVHKWSQQQTDNGGWIQKKYASNKSHFLHHWQSGHRNV